MLGKILTEDEEGLVEAILEFDEDAVGTRVQQLMDAGVEPLQIAEIARQAMEKVGEMFQIKKLFLTELIMAGELLTSIMKRLGFTSDANAQVQDSKGVVLLGTVAGDIHDIGKNIVANILVSNGFHVIDIGVDVPPVKFVEKVQEHEPGVVGLCGLLTVAFDSMKATIDALQEAGLREKIKVIIGGGAVDQKVCDYVGADAWGATASDAVRLCQEYFS
ncbi:MAG TPA: cobalamin-dependent protein [Candidatus Lokiarchaeia archaeon]|nr:cobalamin-dependent protein [Candidatus Lokiarchaeia archaeon]